MYTTSDGYKSAVLQYDKKYESKITIGSKVITNENLISFTAQQSMQQDETFSIGNTISSCLNLIFLHNDVETDDKDIINLKLGLLVNGAYEYIPLGIYNIHSIDSNDTTTTLLCYDNMVKFDIAYSENNENPTLHTVINRLVQLTGVNFGGTLSNYKDYKLTPLKGYSCREVLGFIAGVLGSNAIINREGKFDFVSLSTQPIYAIERFELVTKDGSVVMTKDSEVVEVKAQVGYAQSDNYYDYTKKNKNYKIKKVINSLDTGDISLGSIDDESVCLSIRNPFVDEDILQDIYFKMNGLEFLPYSLNWSGDISIDLGDLMTVTDTKGVMRCHPVLSQTVTYNGALNTILGASGDTKLANTYVVKTEQEAELDRTQEDLEDTKEEVSGVKVEINKMQDSIELKAEKTEVENVKEDVENVKNDVSSINIGLDGITQRVSSVETTTTNLDKKVDTAQSTANTANSTANSNKSEIESTKSKVSTIETNLEGITQRVSSTEETVSTINGDMTNLESRMDSAEQKITKDAIVSTVSSEFYKKTETDNKYLTENSSVITQMADSIESKVNSGDISTIVKQNATSWGLSINGKLSGTNYTFDGSNFTIGSATGSTTAYHNNSQSKWVHSDGSYTLANSSGFMKYMGNTGKSYHYLTTTGTARVEGDATVYPKSITVQLGDEFKGKDFTVTYGASKMGLPGMSIYPNKVVYVGYNVQSVAKDTANATFTISGWSEWYDLTTTTPTYRRGYLDVSYVVVA